MSYTYDIGLVCEGVTDVAVLQNVIIGCFKGHVRLPRVLQTQPVSVSVSETKPIGSQVDNEFYGFSNWELVLEYLKRKKYSIDFQHCQYLVVQIDTDCCHCENYNVKTEVDGKKLAPEELVEEVIKRIASLMGDDFVEYKERMIFAICVHSLECWLITFWGDDCMKSKVNSCSKQLIDVLNAKGEGANAKKEYDCYLRISKEFKKRKTIDACAALNSSFSFFVNQLDLIKRSVVEDVD